jgi:hypothetical protein
MAEFAREYYWVVICKNRLFHSFHRSPSHRILLGETDAYLSPPALEERFSIRCDGCGKAYEYRPADVLRYETEPPDSFVAHPLFSMWTSP